MNTGAHQDSIRKDSAFTSDSPGNAGSPSRHNRLPPPAPPRSAKRAGVCIPSPNSPSIAGPPGARPCLPRGCPPGSLSPAEERCKNCESVNQEVQHKWASQTVLVVKSPPASAGRRKRHRFNPRVGTITWRRAWQPTPVFLPGEAQGQRSLAGCSP